jgi:hypothetical protein
MPTQVSGDTVLYLLGSVDSEVYTTRRSLFQGHYTNHNAMVVVGQKKGGLEV